MAESFTYTYQVPTVTYQSENVYTLAEPITLQGFFQSGATASQVYQDLGDVALQANSSVTVDVNQCQNCDLGISKDFGDKATVYAVSGSSSSGEFIVPVSGQYKIEVDNLGTAPEVVSSIVMTENVSQASTQTELGYNTITVARYSVVALAPNLILGILPSLIVLGVIGLVVAILVLFDRGIIVMDTRRR